HRVLGGRIYAHLRRRAQSRHRRRIDDHPATLGEHHRQLVLHAQPDALDVDAHDGVELRLAAFGQPPLLDLDAGIVEGVIEPPVTAKNPLDHAANLLVTGHVAADEQRLATGGANLRHAGFAAALIE